GHTTSKYARRTACSARTQDFPAFPPAAPTHRAAARGSWLEAASYGGPPQARDSPRTRRARGLPAGCSTGSARYSLHAARSTSNRITLWNNRDFSGRAVLFLGRCTGFGRRSWHRVSPRRFFDLPHGDWQAFVLVGDDAHIPVLELEVCRALAPALTRAGPTAILVDAT